MSKRKTYDDDDGRVIADMSDLERQPMFIPRFDRLKKEQPSQNENGQEAASEPFRDNTELDRGERRALIGGALGAGLAVGAVFIAVIGLVIFLIGRFGG